LVLTKRLIFRELAFSPAAKLLGALLSMLAALAERPDATASRARSFIANY